MRHLLMITYEFPPFNGSGVYRIVKFIKHLRAFGWRCSVLTVDFDPATLQSPDDRLLADLPRETRVLRADCWTPYAIYRRLGGRRRLGGGELSGPDGARARERIGAGLGWLFERLAVPDSKIGWYPDAVRKGAALIRADRPDVILSSSPRETAHLIGRRLARRFALPWIADFRDPWTGAFFKPRPFLPLRLLDRRLERLVVAQASAVVAAWPGIARRLQRNGAAGTGERVHVITNGFDAEDVRKAPLRDLPGFAFAHTGKFLRDKRTPDPFLRALGCLLRRRPDLRARLSIHFVGGCDDFVRDAVARHGLTDVVHFVERVSYEEAQSFNASAACLVLFNSQDETRSVRPGDVAASEYVPGKLYHYIGFRKPILAFVQPDSASAAILRALQNSHIVGGMDPGVVASTIEEIVTARGAGGAAESGGDFGDYDFRQIARRLDGVLRSCLSAGPDLRPEPASSQAAPSGAHASNADASARDGTHGR